MVRKNSGSGDLPNDSESLLAESGSEDSSTEDGSLTSALSRSLEGSQRSGTGLSASQKYSKTSAALVEVGSPIVHLKEAVVDAATGSKKRRTTSQSSKRKDSSDLIDDNANAATAEGSAGLEEDGKESEESEVEGGSINYFSLYRYSSGCERFVVILGAVIAGVTGVVPAIANYSFGKFTKSMVDKGSNISQCPPPPLSNASSSFTTPFMREIETFAIWQCSLGLFEFLAGYFFVLCLNSVAENQVHKIRKKYFEKLLSQDIGWFDVNAKRDFSSRLVEDMLKIQDAISEKGGMLIAYIFNSIFLIALSFFTGWKLSLALMAMFPVLGLATAFNSSVSSRMTEKEQEAYSEAGSVAEEVLTNIRTVHAFNGQEKEIERYDKKILHAKTVAIKKHLLCGLGNGVNWFLAYANYAYAFWYGTHLVLVSRETNDGLYGPENILVIFFSILMAGYYIGDSSQFFQVIAEGAGAARGIFPVLNRVSKIDSLSENGLVPRSRALGEIQFENVKFSYPTRPTVPVLKNLNLTIKPGQTVALVGSSGCGKSTCIALLQRFYDPAEGQVKVDGVDVKDLNIRWLRGQCGVVGQEPVLFRMSIGENIGFGLENVSQEDIERAAKMSFAHEFVSQLPLGYDTCVGERGAQLSGGQKQRIAIARALVRNPPILLLDEATSALDFHSEAIVQAALERARQGRTTLIIAHRLSTIRAADLVVAIDKGEVVECGTHSELLALEGLYYKLVMSQEDKEDLESSPEELLAEENELVDTLEDEMPQLNPDWNSSPTSRRSSSRVRLISETSLADPINDNVVTLKAEDEEPSKEEGTLWRLWRMNFQEWPYLVGAVFCSTVKGLQLPVYAYVFGRYIQIFTSKDDFAIKAKGDWFALVYVFIATVVGIDGVFQYLFIGISGENFTYRIRKLLFSTLVEQDVSFYDEGENTVGNLCSRLSTDATSLRGVSFKFRGVTGSRLSGVIQSGTIVLAAGAMSFYLIPKMSAVTMLFVPVMIYGAFLEGRVLGSSNVIEKESIEKSCNLAVEALNNVRTVASLCAERKFLQMYDEALADAHRINKKRSHIRGMVYGLVNSGAYFCYALSVFYGGYLVENECVLIGNVFTVAEALIFCTTSGGAALAIAPDYDKGKIAAVRIFKLLERVPGISKFTSNQKLVGIKENPEGKVGMEKVSFYYRSRPSVRVLQKVDFMAQPGTNVALVGPSGSGKSTVAALILRFYDPSSGIMRFDDQNLKEVDLNNLRHQISLVSQEPNLFDYSIAENVAYGDNSREVPMSEIIEICKTANIHDFIAGLPAGYETRVGSLGVQLSGGQKQRVAIARALIRHPKLLVLDEATSALDMESEKVVQDALEVAKAGRTCITIAHRLSSIQNADQIIVMKNGRIREIGTHSDLIRREDGLYHGMWFAQRTQTQIQDTTDKN